MMHGTIHSTISTAPRSRLRLVVGAVVLTRDGRTVTITNVDPDCHISTKPVEGVFTDGQIGKWMLDGRFWYNGQDDGADIVGPAQADHASTIGGDGNALADSQLKLRSRASFTKPSFFADIPAKAIPAAQSAWDGISSTRHIVVDGFYIAFCQKLQALDVEPPARHEFVDWFRQVRDGEVDRPREPSAEPVGRQPVDLAEFIPAISAAPERARRAHAIIVQAVRLQDAMIDAGYSAESCDLEDQIIAEAIKEWLKAEAGDWGETMNLPTTPAEIAVGYLNPSDSEQSAKLLDVFATHLQRELCLAITGARTKGGKA